MEPSLLPAKSIQSAKRWVVKIGSALVTNHGKGLDSSRFAGWVSQIAKLKRSGKDVILVSSGAVAEGVARMGWANRPTHLHELQAAAAIGQMGLVQAYENQFQRYNLHTAQVLLTHDDLSDRQRYLNARSTLITLLDMGVIPVINENDTVVTDEIKFGDNDTLAALVVNLVEAQMLVILTDQSGMYTADPRSNPNATLLRTVDANDPRLEEMATGSVNGLGRGGMVTKVKAAQLAARSGAHTLITSGDEPDVLIRVSNGEPLGTTFVPKDEPIAARKRWIVGHLKPQGVLHLDQGAAEVVEKQGKSLLAVGVVRVEGDFERGAMVSCMSPSGKVVACGLVNYASGEVLAIAGRPSTDIEGLLGYKNEESLIHRDNLVIL